MEGRWLDFRDAISTAAQQPFARTSAIQGGFGREGPKNGRPADRLFSSQRPINQPPWADRQPPCGDGGSTQPDQTSAAGSFSLESTPMANGL